MRRPAVFLAATLSLAAAPASAQVLHTPPAQTLDATHQRQHDALLTVRDSLTAVRGALGAMTRDLDGASRELVLARAERLTRQCRGAGSAARGAQPALCPTCGQPAHASARSTLRQTLAELGRALERCAREFAIDTLRPDLFSQADTVRAWVPYRLQRLNHVLRLYDDAASRYLGRVNIRLETPSEERARAPAP